MTINGCSVFTSIQVELIEKWQGITDLLANIISVSAVLIIKDENGFMETFVCSKSANNSYHTSNRKKWYGQYCETVIKTQKELLVSDITSDQDFYKNPDKKPEMTAYFGYPINYPDKTPFGTLCVLDNKKNSITSDQKNLLKQFCSVLEMDLALFHCKHQNEQLRKELTESRHQYQTLADSGPALIWKSGFNKKCDYFNQSWLAFTGRTLEQELGDGWTKGVHPDDLQYCIDTYTKAFDRREKFSMIYRLRDAKNNYRWIQDNGTPRFNSNGVFLGYIGNCLDITNIKETEVKMRESELLTRAIMENLPIGISVNSVDSGVNFTYMNEKFSKIYRTSPEALCAPDSFWDEVYEDPDLRKTIKKRVLDDCASGDPKRMYWENIPISHNGHVEAYISAQNIPIPGKKLMVSLVWDVTEKKKADELMQQNEQRYRTIVESAPDAVFVQTEKKFVYLNSHAVKLFGAKNETELLGQPVLDRFHPDFQKPILDKIELLDGERQPIKDVIAQKYRRIDGSEIWVEIAGFPIIFEGKNSALVLLRDITERKKAEDSLAEEKERLSVTLRSIGDGVITTDIDGNIVLMNKVAEELTGWKQDDAAGKELSTVFKIINESTRKPHENPVQKVLSTGKVIELANHTVLVSRNGIERVIADSGAPILDKNGVIIGVVLVFRDTTEKQKFLEITQKSQKLESLGVLAGGIAHDFNNLLGGIFGYIDMARETAKDEKAMCYLTKAMNSIDRARDLTRQLVTFAKGGAPVQKSERLMPFIQDTVLFSLSGANAKCNFDIPHDLWNCNIDKNQISQVIDNIIINAQQAMPLGGIIEVSARNVNVAEKEHPMLSKGRYVILSIKDSGIGMPKELLTRIFDPFFTTKALGQGLGLATCYSIISRHNGCIDVESVPDKGSTFHVYLPASAEIKISIGEKPDMQHKGNGTFLVMDDEEIIRETIGDMLISFGYSVVFRNNGRDAIDLFKNEIEAGRSFAGMIFDLTIPGGMGGKEAIVEIRKLDSEIPVFVTSGYSEGPVMKNPAQYGFTASLCKPFRRIEFMEMLQKHMKS